MRYLFFLLTMVTVSSCAMIDRSKIERQMLIEGKFDCETGEYYLAHSGKMPNKHSPDPNATMTLEQYACARYGQIPKGKEVKSFEYFKELQNEHNENLFVLFVPCNYIKDKTHMCKY